MKPIEIKSDLEKRKRQIALVSAYSPLRKYINFLSILYIVAVVLWTVFEIFLLLNDTAKTGLRNSVASQGLGTDIFAIALIQSIGFAALIIFIAIAVKDFSLAMIDSVDLQLLSNRRNALERKDPAAETNGTEY